MTNIIDELIKKSNLSENEIRAKIDEKVKKYPGLFTEESAAYVIAKDLGIDLDDKEIILTPLNIIDNTIKTVNFVCTVEYIFPEKSYEKNNRKGKYTRLIVNDNGTKVNLTLWDKFSDWAKESKLKRGSTLLCKNISVSKFRGLISLGTTNFSEIKITGEKEIKAEKKKISELKESDFFISVEGKIVSKREKRNFEKSRLIGFRLYDGFFINATAWDEAADKIESIETGKSVLIEGAYVRRRNFLELNVPADAKISISDKVFEIKSDESIDLKQISELSYNDRSKIKAKVKGIDKLVNYRQCKNCNKKLSEENCSCGSTDIKENYIVILNISDDSAASRAVLFKRPLTKILKIDNIEALKKDEFNSKLAELIEKEYVFIGYLKKNDYSNNDEFIVSKVMEE